MIRTYMMLTKPGIIMGNLITAAGGFALASQGRFDFFLLFAMLLGLALVIASACVFNNFLDRELDRKMKRTKRRALARGVVSALSALLFGGALLLGGGFILASSTNLLTLFLALFGFVVYVGLYGVSKVKTVHGTLIGSIAGAVPPVVGYCSVTGRFDLGAFLLFLILVLWQMPHFLAIAMYYVEDYAAASIPVVPVTKGMYAAKVHIFWYTLAFTAAVLILPLLGYTGIPYLLLILPFCAIWIWFCWKGFYAPDDRVWAKSMYRYSIVVVTVFSMLLVV